MKIGILTFHDGINHGAYLQCYGLYKTIENLGNDVKIINYKNFKHWWKEYKCFLWTKNPHILYNNIRKIFKFKVEQRKLPKTSFTFSHEKVNKEEFDIVVVGSDIIWNYKNPFFGFDSIYFGYFLNSKKIISYAGSFGEINVNDNIPCRVSKGFKNFYKISVRDENSLNILAKIGYKSVNLVLDPTLLYDFTKEEKKCVYKNFILIYAYQINLDQIKQVKEFAKKKNLDIIAIAYNQPWCDRNIIAVSPFEWLGYFRQADYIITSTFHGTIFSIKYEKNFVTIPNVKIDNKTKFILSSLGLEDRVWQKDKKLGEIISKKIKYIEINEKLNINVRNSLDFLYRALKYE